MKYVLINRTKRGNAVVGGPTTLVVDGTDGSGCFTVGEVPKVFDSWDEASRYRRTSCDQCRKMSIQTYDEWRIECVKAMVT